jgi:hypothetical protein
VLITSARSKVIELPPVEFALRRLVMVMTAVCVPSDRVGDAYNCTVPELVVAEYGSTSTAAAPSIDTVAIVENGSYIPNHLTW